VLISIVLAGFLVLASIPLVDAQCPYRSPFSRLLLRTWQFSYLTGSYALKVARIVLSALTCIPSRLDERGRTESLTQCVQNYSRSLSSVSWDFQDRRYMDHLTWSHDFAMQATADVIMNCPSSDVLLKMTAGIYEAKGDSSWIPIRNLWYLLEGLLGDDLASRENVIKMLKASDFRKLYGASSLSKEFCQVIASLVRQAVRSQYSCPTSEDLELARCAVHLTSILAHSERAVFPYHTTTLAWLLHHNAPEELRQVAATNIASLAHRLSSKGISMSYWSNWSTPGKLCQSPTSVAQLLIKRVDVVEFFKATTASLEHHITTPAQLHVSFVALHIASHHLQAITQFSDSEVVPALQGVLHAIERWLRRGILPTTRAGASQSVLSQDWCLLIAKVMEDKTLSSDRVSIMPVSLVCVLLDCLGRTPDPEWTTWTDTNMSEGRASVLANVLRAEVLREYGPPAGPLPLNSATSQAGTENPTLNRLGRFFSRAPRLWTRAQRPPMVVPAGRMV
jgi:hypothetical protein